MYLLLNYNDISSDISSITLVASNDYSTARSSIEVTHDDVIRNNHRWYIYLVIGLAGLLFLIGLSYGLIKYYLRQKKRKEKIKRLSETNKVSLI